MMSYEIDLVESDISQFLLLKSWGAEVFSKICPLPLLWEIFKVTAPPVTCYCQCRREDLLPHWDREKRSVRTGHNSAKGFLVHFLRAFFEPSANITTC